MIVKIGDIYWGKTIQLMLNTGPGEGGRSRQPERIA